MEAKLTILPNDFPEEVKQKLKILEDGTKKNLDTIDVLKKQLTADDIRSAINLSNSVMGSISTKSTTTTPTTTSEESFLSKNKYYLMGAGGLILIIILFFIIKKKK